MSARAASRLATLEFTDVYRYQAGKADWFAAGLPREGAEAHVPRVADVAERDVPTCGLHEHVGDLQKRVRAARRDVCVVVDSEHIVLGIVDAEALSGDPTTVAENIMKPDPVTFRPHLRTVSIKRAGRAPCPHVRDLVRRKADDLDQRFRDLTEVRDGLRALLTGWRSTGLGSAAVCPHIEKTGSTQKSTPPPRRRN